MKIEKIIEETKEDLKTWFEKLNLIIGLTAIGFAGFFFKSKHPEIFAWFFIIVIFITLYVIRHYFPTSIKKLRAKKNKSEAEIILLKGMEAHFLNIRKSFKEAPLYWIGMLLLLAVANGFKEFFSSKILIIFGG